MSWLSYSAKRILISIGVLIGVSVLIFAIVRLVPGDPARIILGQQSTEETYQAIRQQLGLNLPVWKQYLLWAADIISGDWGRSLITGKSIESMLVTRYPRSLQLSIMALVLALVIAIPIGIISAINRNSSIDYFSIFFSQFGVSMPSFFLGLILILVFARYLNVLPPSGYVSPLDDPVSNLKHTILPASTLAIINAAIITRYLRSEMLEELSKDYVRTAKAFGHPNRRIVRKYVLRNALIPTTTIIGIQFAYMMGGLVVIEKVFSFPGVGVLLLDSLITRDYPLIQVSLLALAGTIIATNLIIDLAYGWLDPRIRY